MAYIGKKPADIIATAVDTTTGTFSGDIDASTVNATGDTAAGDNAAIGFTSAEGLILTGQGSTSDITVKNDADATVFTVPTGTDDILFPDNAKAMFGAGSDLQIYHTGAHSLISEQGTGSLILLTNQLDINNAGNSENMITATSDGAVSLFHDNSKKLETTSSGFKSTGAGSVSINLGSTNAGGVQIVLDGDSDGDFTGSDYSYIRHETDGRIDFVQDSPSGTNEIRFYTETLERFRLTNSAAVFNEAGNDVDFRVESDNDSSAFFVNGETGNTGFGTSTTPASISIYTNTSSANNFDGVRLRNVSTSSNQYGGALFVGLLSGGIPQAQVRGPADGNGMLIFQTGSSETEHFRIAGDGTLTATDTSIGSNSDSRLKKDIEDYTYDIDKFKAFRTRTFEWINKEEHGNKTNCVGFVAQEVESTDTRWVDENQINDTSGDGTTNADWNLIPENEKGIRKSKTSKLGEKDAMYISVIQQLIARIEALEGA